MAKLDARTDEEKRVAHAQQAAQDARDKELARRKAIKDAQGKAQAAAHRPLVTAGG